MSKDNLIKKCLVGFFLNSLLQTFILLCVAVLLVVGITTNKPNKIDSSVNSRVSYVQDDYFYYENGDLIKYLYINLNSNLIRFNYDNYLNGGIDYFPAFSMKSINSGDSIIYDVFLVVNYDNKSIYYAHNLNDLILNIKNSPILTNIVVNSDNELVSYNGSVFTHSLYNNVYYISLIDESNNIFNPIPYRYINSFQIIDDLGSEFSGVGSWISSTATNLFSMFYVNGSFTFVGYLAIGGLAFAVVFLLLFLIERFLHFRG